jgi:hypothetical protein
MKERVCVREKDRIRESEREKDSIRHSKQEWERKIE